VLIPIHVFLYTNPD